MLPLCVACALFCSDNLCVGKSSGEKQHLLFFFLGILILLFPEDKRALTQKKYTVDAVLCTDFSTKMLTHIYTHTAVRCTYRCFTNDFFALSLCQNVMTHKKTNDVSPFQRYTLY